MSEIYELYKSVGIEEFGKMIVGSAPYFSTIYPQFKEIRPGYVEISVENRKEIHNHMGTVHAAAMCNAAELVGGLMTEISIPEGRRWIPSGMTVQYLAKAKTDLRIVAEGKGIDWSVLGKIVVPADIFDVDNRKVFSARITMNIKEMLKNS